MLHPGQLQKDTRKQQDSKRGVFTSKDMKESHQANDVNKPSVLPYLQSSLQGVREKLYNLKTKVNSIQHERNTINTTNPLRLSQLGYSYSNNNNQQQIYIQPNVHQVRRSTTPTKVNFNYVGHLPPTYGNHVPTPVINHTLVPPLPLISGGQQVQYVPISDNRVQNIQIRRTVVPVHYTNQIPTRIVVNPNSLNLTPPYKPHNTSIDDSQNDQAYEVLMRQYTKLYQTLAKTQDQRNSLQQQLTKLKQRKNLPEPIPQPQQVQKHGFKRKYSLNVEQLHNKLYKIYQKTVKDIISKRKQSGRQRIEQLFDSAKKQMSTITTTMTSEVVTKSYKIM